MELRNAHGCITNDERRMLCVIRWWCIHHSPPQKKFHSWLFIIVLTDKIPGWWVHSSWSSPKKKFLKKGFPKKKTLTIILHLLKGKFIKQITNKFLFISPSFSHYMIFFPFLIDLRHLKTVKENKFCKEFFFSIF